MYNNEREYIYIYIYIYIYKYTFIVCIYIYICVYIKARKMPCFSKPSKRSSTRIWPY